MNAAGLDRSSDLQGLAREERGEEKKTLQAIYDDTVFQEIIHDRVWIFKLQPSFIGKYCRKSAADAGNAEIVLNLEVRFPPGSLYPFEPPIACISTSHSDIDSGLPAFACLNIAQQLVDLTREHAQHHTPSVFSLLSFVESESDMEECLQRRPLAFSLPASKAGAQTVLSDALPSDASLFQRRREGNQLADSYKEMLKLNPTLKRRFDQKSASPSYVKISNYRQTLPAWAHRQRIVSTVAASPVVVISGMTGCGKSTQVPQFLLDDFLTSHSEQHRYIICTQPRRISAVAVAQRVAEERDERVGQTVGYQVLLKYFFSLFSL